MVAAISPPDEYQRIGTTAFAIPSELLLQVYPGFTSVSDSKLLKNRVPRNKQSNAQSSGVQTLQQQQDQSSDPLVEPSEIISQYTIQDNALEKHVATDKPIQSIEQDKLGFSVYVTALHDFIVSQDTTTPLTISVDGPWGTGKSSLMYMLKNSLEPRKNIWQRFVSWLASILLWWKWLIGFLLATPVKFGGKTLLRLILRIDEKRNQFVPRLEKDNKKFVKLLSDISEGLSTNPEVLKQKDNKLSPRVKWWANVHAKCEPMGPLYHPTIWLNAWKFDNQEEVWASLALATLEQIKQKHNIFWMMWFRIRLTFKRMSFISALGLVLLQFALPVILGIIAFYYSVIIDSFDTPLKAFDVVTKGYGRYLLWAGGILSGILTVSSVVKDPFQIPVDKIFDRPNYKEKVGFLSKFEMDFAKIVELATNNGFGWKKSKLIIFVDDLDRCEPPKSADIIEAVNLFLDAEGCVFVVGMDSESVSKSIEVKYKDLFTRMKAENAGVVSLGRAFLEKIVQVPFTVPRATPIQILNMVEDTFGANTFKGIAIAQPETKSADETSGKVQDQKSEVTLQTSGPVESNPEQKTITDEPKADEKPDEKFDPASFARAEVRQAIRLGTDLLSENPRQVKTFINLFRLSIYIANARGYFAEGRKGKILRVIGLDRLAVWVACSVRWQSIVRHLYEETQMGSLCEFLYEVSQNITIDHKWNTGNKNIPVKLEKKFDGLRKAEKDSEAHWCHLPWDWWLLEPDFLKVAKLMEDLWAPPAEGKTDELKMLLNMSRPLAPTSEVQAK